MAPFNPPVKRVERLLARADMLASLARAQAHIETTRTRKRPGAPQGKAERVRPGERTQG